VCIGGDVPVKVEEDANTMEVDKLGVLQEEQPVHGKTTAAPQDVMLTPFSTGVFIDALRQSKEAIHAQGADHAHVDAQAGSNEVISAQGADEAQSGITDGVGVPVPLEVASPPENFLPSSPPGWNGSQPPVYRPEWFSEVMCEVKSTVAESMKHAVLPRVLEAITALGKRVRDEEPSGSDSCPSWQGNATSSRYQWGSDDSSWNCSSKIDKTNASGASASSMRPRLMLGRYRLAETCKHPNWNDKPGSLYASMSTLLATLTEKGPKPTTF